MSSESRIEELQRRLDPHLNAKSLAEYLAEYLRHDRARALTIADHAQAFLRRDQRPAWVPMPSEESIDLPKLMAFLAALVCPMPCVGVVNATGWHQLCEKRAQSAIAALGFTPPDLTPIPNEDPR